VRRNVLLRLAGIVASALLLAVPGAAVAQTNVVVIVSDDQSVGSLDGMPYVSKHFEEIETLYDNYALCCPARATLFSGLFSHHTGVESNDGSPFDDSTSFSNWFDDAGYDTALIGKYLNFYPFDRGRSYVPPGWDTWAAFMGSSTKDAYYDYQMNVDGRVRKYGSRGRDYSTDVVARRGVRFVNRATKPFLLYAAPHGPHAPFTAAPRHEGMFDDAPIQLPPNFNQAADRAPRFYRKLPAQDPRREKDKVRAQLAALQSVDEMVKGISDAVEARGLLDRTVFLYLSDNGLSLGSHRWNDKSCAYEECGHVPAAIRIPGGADGSGILASNADLAPTLADLADVPAPATDGVSLAPQLMGGQRPADPAVLIRNGGHKLPSVWGLRTRTWKYVEHGQRAGRPRVELYNLESDPYELQNLHGTTDHAGIEATLAERLEEAKAASPPGPQP